MINTQHLCWDLVYMDDEVKVSPCGLFKIIGLIKSDFYQLNSFVSDKIMNLIQCRLSNLNFIQPRI